MVQIDNMKMPKNCFDCDLSYDYFRCAITRTNYYEDEQFNPSEERLPDCPLREVQPVRHGHWIIPRFGADAQCSECGFYFPDVYDMESKDLYCRHCGAKMNKEA